MGFLLDRNKPADWTKDPTVPAPVEPVKAAAQPGAVREGFQTLYSLIWSKLRGQVTYGAMQIEVGGGDGSVPFPALTATEGLRVVLRREQQSPRIFLSYDLLTGLRVYGETLLSGFDQTGNLFVRAYANNARVVVDQSSVQFLQQGGAGPGDKVKNALVQELCPRAWGTISIVWDGGGTRTLTIVDGFGISSVSVQKPGLVGFLRVSWGQAMASTSYVVSHEGVTNGSGGEPRLPMTLAKTTGYADIAIMSLSNPPTYFDIDAPHTNVTVLYGFVVFGRQ